MFVRVKGDSSFISGILKHHLNTLVRPFMRCPWPFIHTYILLFKCG